MNDMVARLLEHNTRMLTYIIWTLLKFPNSAGTDPVRWFLLKFLHEQLGILGNKATMHIDKTVTILKG